MKSEKNVEQAIKKKFSFTASTELHDRMLDEVLNAQEKSKKTTSAVATPGIGGLIMKSPILKLAGAAVIIALVVLGLFEFIETENASSVVWAEVARKVETSRGLVVRYTESFPSIPESLSFLKDSDYAIKYVSPTHSRTDFYKAGQITHTFYTDFSGSDTDTLTQVYHIHKHYLIRTNEKSKYKFLLEQHDDWINPRYLVQTILSCEHRKLGQKTIEGVLCEGIETTDPASMGPLPELIDLLEVQLRLWVDAKMEYPVLFESKKKMSAELDGKVIVMASEGIMDQFQWDVELDPGIFEPNIPPDYIDIRTLKQKCFLIDRALWARLYYTLLRWLGVYREI
jgi:hypothetical protein